jgi:septal ring factor EnvC (AmiA/AmiB activator)
MRKILILTVVSAALAARCLAQIPVTDAANLSQNIINYAALINQLSNQAQQITNQVQQIQQMDNQLNRMGNMANITAVIGFPQLQFDQSSPTQIQTWSQNLATVNGSGLFGDSRGGVYQPVAGQFTDFNGAPVERDPDTYMPAQAVTSQVDNFKAVQADIYARRQALKTAIAQTSDALQAATTDAEEQKLEAVLSAQYSQLASLDSEVELSAAEVQVKMAEANAMANAQTTADAEARRTLAQQEGTKIGSTFKPIYDSILTYVSERPFSP